MRVDGERDVLDGRVHFDGERDLGDHVARVRPDQRATNDAVGVFVDNQLGKAVVAAVCQRAAGSGPREDGFFDAEVLCGGLQFGDAGPGNFRRGVGDARDDARVEEAVGIACGNLRGDVRFVYAFVCQHRLADDVADGVDVGLGGAHLFVHFDEAAFVYIDVGCFEVQLVAVRCAADGDEDAVIALRFGRCLAAFKGDVDAVFFGTRRHGFGAGHDVVEAVVVAFFPDFDEVFVRASHQGVRHFNDIHLRAEGGVHGRHFEADDAAADDEQAFGNVFQGERAGGVHDAFVFRHEGQFDAA